MAIIKLIITLTTGMDNYMPLRYLFHLHQLILLADSLKLKFKHSKAADMMVGN